MRHKSTLSRSRKTTLFRRDHPVYKIRVDAFEKHKGMESGEIENDQVAKNHNVYTVKSEDKSTSKKEIEIDNRKRQSGNKQMRCYRVHLGRLSAYK